MGRNDTAGRRPAAPGNARGQGLVEYAFILLLVAVVVFAILKLLGKRLDSDFYQPINSGVTDAAK